MTNIFSKAFVAAPLLVFVSGAAEARGFLEQAVIDAGNGIKAVGSVVAPPSSPSPNIPSQAVAAHEPVHLGAWRMRNDSEGLIGRPDL